MGLTIDRIVWHPALALERIRIAEHLAGERAGRVLLEAANRQVPYRTGRLRESGAVEQVDGETIVSYSDPVARYVHGHPQWNFEGGRSGRWFEDAIHETGDILGLVYGETMHAELGG